jgi:hypothetical protein
VVVAVQYKLIDRIFSEEDQNWIRAFRFTDKLGLPEHVCASPDQFGNTRAMQSSCREEQRQACQDSSRPIQRALVICSALESHCHASTKENTRCWKHRRKCYTGEVVCNPCDLTCRLRKSRTQFKRTIQDHRAPVRIFTVWFHWCRMSHYHSGIFRCRLSHDTWLIRPECNGPSLRGL